MRPEMDTSPLPRLPARSADGHKGTFGMARIIGGSRHCAQNAHRAPAMLGAVAFAARAAVRSGVGLVRLTLDEEMIGLALQMCPYATVDALPADGDGSPAELAVCARGDAVVVGPGAHPRSRTMIDVVTMLSALDVVAPSLVLDAGALGLLSVLPGMLLPETASRIVLTPHPGEFVRLAEAFGVPLEVEDASWGRPEAAAALARATGTVVVLKGRGTVVSDGARAWVCERGHACLATGGTGDVLAGLIGGLLAQWRAAGDPGLDEYELSRIAVEAHARAGELWAERRRASAGLLPDELADLLPEVLEGLRTQDIGS